MGQGSGWKSQLAANRAAKNGTGPATQEQLAQQAIQQAMMTAKQAVAAAYYNKLDKNSLQRQFMDALIARGGHGGLGPIMLRMGTPRSKLNDLYNALKPLSEHGLINDVVPLSDIHSSDKMLQIEVQSTLTRADIRKLSHYSSDVLAAILDTFKNNV